MQILQGLDEAMDMDRLAHQDGIGNVGHRAVETEDHQGPLGVAPPVFAEQRRRTVGVDVHHGDMGRIAIGEDAPVGHLAREEKA